MKLLLSIVVLQMGVMRSSGLLVSKPTCLTSTVPHQATHKRRGISLQSARRIANRNTNDEYWEYDDSDILEEANSNPQRPLDFEAQPPTLDWEECEDGTWVLLPPSYITRPTAIIHFCGGTFFGSSPKLWYGPLLEGIVRDTSSVIIATSIPITLVENPLQHVLLARKLQRQFQSAYVNVVEDEYSEYIDYDDSDENSLSTVPVVALGHSLGSRLLAVLATLAPPKNPATPPYKGYILMGFTNYGASTSIPGVQQLMKSRNRLDSSKNSAGRRTSRRAAYGKSDIEDEDEFLHGDELDETIEEIQDLLWQQSAKVRDALTPLSEDLEFYPSPDQLWDALAKEKRYNIPETLIVQFDDDEVDQSSKLASILVNSTNLKYAFLRGNHLSPVSVEASEGSWLSLPSKATKALLKIMSGRSSQEKSTDRVILRDLRQSITRYITDVIATSSK